LFDARICRRPDGAAPAGLLWNFSYSPALRFLLRPGSNHWSTGIAAWIVMDHYFTRTFDPTAEETLAFPRLVGG
jgi:hypothetical protein